MDFFLNQNAKYLIIIASFISIYCFIITLHLFFNRNRLSTLNRLEQFDNREINKTDIREAEMAKPFFQRVIQPCLASLAQVSKNIMPAKKEARLNKKIIMAGKPGNLSPGEFAVLQYSMAFAVTTLSIAISGAILETYMVMAVGATSAIIGYNIPLIYLNNKIAIRKQSIQNDLPDVLDLLTISVEAGLGFDGALVKVVDKSDGVLSEEFKRVLQEVNKGKERKKALKDMALRCDVDDLSTFIGAVVQAEQLGVSIGNVLRLQSEQMRLKRRQIAEEKAMKAPVKMLIPLVFFIFPTIFIVLLGPAVIQIMETFLR